MPKNQVIYNQKTLLVGPAPSTGFHSIAQDGALNDEPPSATNRSLLFPIQRVNSFSYSYSLPRVNIQQLGDAGIIKNPILNNNEIELNFSYYLMGLVNEVRMGLSANIPSGNNQTGRFLYGTGRVPVISGLMDRGYDRSNETIFRWPLSSREPKNIFLLAGKDSLDVNDTSGSIYSKNGNYHTYGFGDCYLKSYSTTASVGAIPQAQMNLVCNNINVYDGVSGYIPSVNSKDFSKNSLRKFYVPNNFESTGLPTVLLTKDISLSIKESNGDSNLNNIGYNFNDIKLQSYNISFDFDREPLIGVGHSYPVDRPINLPTFVNVSFDAIVGDSLSGSVVDLIKNDVDYDITIKLSYRSNSYFSGVAIQYDVLKAKFNGFNDSISIDSRDKVSFSFAAEMKNNDTTKGLFLSGYLGILSNKTGDSYLLADDFYGLGSSSYLVTEDGNFISIYDSKDVSVSY